MSFEAFAVVLLVVGLVAFLGALWLELSGR